MQAFWKAIKLSFRYKWSIVGSVISSILIALLWGASISAIFPIIKVVLEGETAQSWIANEINNSELAQKHATFEIEKLQQQKLVEPENDHSPIDKQITRHQDRHRAEQKSKEYYLHLKPYADNYMPQAPFPTLVLVMLWLLLTTIAKAALLVTSTLLVARIANRTGMDMQRIYFGKALELDQAKIDQIGTSDMLTHLTVNMSMVSGGLQMLYGKSLREPLKLITCLIGAALISLPLLIISLLVIPAGVYLIRTIAVRMKVATTREIRSIADVYQTLVETFSSLKTVRMFNREITERYRFKENTKSVYRMSIRIAFYDSLLRPTSEIMGIIAIALSMMAGAYLVLTQETYLFGIHVCDRPMQPSMLILFYSMLAGISDPARKMSEIVNSLTRAELICTTLEDTFDVESETKKPNAENIIPVPTQPADIEFRNVNFAYQEHDVLHDISLHVPAGQIVAIIGGNGSGKSTIMNLLARFYSPREGQILFGEQDVVHMHPKKMRRQISWVTQQSVLFRGTVWENVEYGLRGATNDQVEYAIQVARLDEVIKQLPEGHETQVGDNGCFLSAGQRQRVALARAILADPLIFILDEATSQMDGHTESLVHQSLAEFLKGRTTFIITHRESSIKLAHRLIVMDNGRIVQDDLTDQDYGQSDRFRHLFAKAG